MQLAEKFGIPFLVGKYASGTSLAEQQRMLSNLAGMVQSAVAVIPQGGAIEILEGAQKASSEIHSSLKAAMDAEMSKVIMGQTLTAEVSDKGGSRAQGQVHEDILEDFRQGDQKLVKTVMEEIAWLYGQVNAPGVPTPALKWFVEEDTRKGLADRDKVLQETGVRFAKGYFVRQYGLQEDDFELTPATSAQQIFGYHLDAGVVTINDVRTRLGLLPVPGGDALMTPVTKSRPSAAFAEKPLSLDYAEQQLERLDTQAKPAMHAMIVQIRRQAYEAESLEDLRNRLLALWPNLDAGQLADVMAEALATAQMAGRYDILEGL